MRGPPLAFMALDSFASTKGCSESEEAQQLIRWLVLTSDKKGFVSRHSPSRPHRSTHIDRLPPSAPEQSSYHFDHHHNLYKNHNSHNQSNHNNHNQSKHHHHSNRHDDDWQIASEPLLHPSLVRFIRAYSYLCRLQRDSPSYLSSLHLSLLWTLGCSPHRISCASYRWLLPLQSGPSSTGVPWRVSPGSTSAFVSRMIFRRSRLSTRFS